MLCFVDRKDVGAVGGLTTHINDILGRGEQDVPSKTRTFLDLRFGKLKVKESLFVRVVWK